MVERVVVADQLPAGFAVVAAVNRTGEETGDGMRADEIEERSLFDSGQQFDLLRRVESGELGLAWEALCGLRREFLQTVDVRRLVFEKVLT